MKQFHLVLCLLAIATIKAQTNVGTSITSNTVFTPAGNPYILPASTVTISSGATLKIMPGVQIKGNIIYKIQVNGNLECVGKADSMIDLDMVDISFNKTATDYNPNTGKGAQFKYTRFLSSSIANYNVETYGTDILFSHCIFHKKTYAISAMNQDSLRLWIDNSRFIGGPYSDYSIYGLGKSSFLNLDKDSFENHYYLYGAENNVIKNCIFMANPSTSSYGIYFQNFTKNIQLECNNFYKTYYGVYAYFSFDSLKNCLIKNNVFDSNAYSIYMVYTTNLNSKIKINQNAFLKNRTYNLYTAFSSNTAPATILDGTSNYWGSADSNVFKAKIYDYRKSTTIKTWVDFSNFLTTNSVTCPPNAYSPKTLVLNNKNVVTTTLSIFPNPAKDKIQWDADLKIQQVKCMDLLGNIVFIQTGIDIKSIDIGKIKAGIYLLELESEQHQKISSRISVNN